MGWQVRGTDLAALTSSQEMLVLRLLWGSYSLRTTAAENGSPEQPGNLVRQFQEQCPLQPLPLPHSGLLCLSHPIILFSLHKITEIFHFQRTNTKFIHTFLCFYRSIMAKMSKSPKLANKTMATASWDDIFLAQ